MSFNFKGVEAAKPNSYLKPGYYRARITDVKSGQFDSQIPYLDVTFQTKEGLAISEKFVLKTKDPNSKFNPISRLVYLHENWVGSSIDQDFKSPDDVASYFKKVLTAKSAGAKTIIVGGEINGKITYGRIPLAGFVVEGDVTLGEFEEGGEEWNKYVKKSNRVTEATGKSGGLLNDDDDDLSDDDDDDAGFDDEPTPPVTKKTPAAKKTADKPAAKKTDKPAAKKPAAPAPPVEDEDDAPGTDDDDAASDDDDFSW
jgi:hypothetical protein